jgi:hypothetical protein
MFYIMDCMYESLINLKMINHDYSIFQYFYLVLNLFIVNFNFNFTYYDKHYFYYCYRLL